MKIHRPGTPKPQVRKSGTRLSWILMRGFVFAVCALLLMALLHFGDEGAVKSLFALVLVALGILGVMALFKDAPESAPPVEAPPRPALPRLAGAAGRWVGTNRLHHPHGAAAQDTPSTLTVRPMPGGEIVRIDQEWAHEGEPEEGHFVVFAETPEKHGTLLWVDTWHHPEDFLYLNQDGTIADRYVFVGHYAAPPGPEWTWRIELQVDPAGTLRLTMFNISPERESALAVEATFRREGEGKSS